MADSKITALGAAASVTTDDLVVMVDDPAGTPTNKKATVAQVRAAMMPAVLTADVSGVLPVANGGTGQSSLTSGNILLGNGAGAVSSFTPGAGVQTFLTTPSSANLAAALTDETGTGAAVFGTSPTFLTDIRAGTTPATFGEIRLSNNWFVWARDFANGTNVSLLGLNASDVIVLGGGLGANADIEIDAGATKTATVRGQSVIIKGNAVQIGSTSGGVVDVGGGTGVVGLDDASVVPSTNPTGGIIIYSDSGVLKYRQPGGTVVALSGASVPTGTGFVHITSGAQDAAAVAVNLASAHVTGTLPAGNGGTGLNGSSLIGTAGSLLQVNGTSDGYVTLALGSGVATLLGTFSSANLRSALTDETGTGAAVFANTPTLVTPDIGAATGTSLAATSFVSVGASAAGAGLLRFPYSTSATLIGVKDSAAADQGLLRQIAGDSYQLGITGASLTLNGGVISLNANGNARIDINTTGAKIYNPIQLGGGAFDLGGGTGGILGIDNASADPSTNPTGGGILYASSGALKYRGSSGTVTTVAPAEPHCPRCGRDFVVEHRNDDAGDHVGICIPCLLTALAGAGIDPSLFTTTDKRVASKQRWDAIQADTAAREEAEIEARNVEVTAKVGA